PAELCAAAVLHHRLGQAHARSQALDLSPELLDWSSAGVLRSVFEYAGGETTTTLEVRADGAGGYEVRGGAAPVAIAVRDMGDDRARLDVGGEAMEVIFAEAGAGTLHLATATLSFTVADLARSAATGADEAGGGAVTAPMHGSLIDIFVEEGARVAKGDRLAVLEAMKMQHEILAQVDGAVTAVLAAPGAQLAADDLILEITPDTEAAA
ncbi:MAG: hypothetical protein MI723_19610, partial [Caulobacterales bacterium]|nr:hypothetical protein [Caulobacterales bacterium]